MKEDPAQQKEPTFLGKAGWLKKAPGRLLASYKERYIQVVKTEIVVYENEDLQNCLERLDLENYDKCHELKSPFTKKHRLILIRSPKSGNKVHDVKFQTQNAEEKEAWIKALRDGICRAKNKIFDEVKIDETSNLEHVTRSRPKGNRNRRPPTRIHMKEVAGVSSDGILRLDLDLENATIPNGAHHDSADGTKTVTSVPKAQSSEPAEKQLELIAEENAETEPEISPQKKVIKPPMPPNKGAKSSPAPEEEPNNVDVAEKKVLKPPMPPAKEVKPSVTPVEETTENTKPETVSEMSPDAKKKAGPPPTPPSKPSSSPVLEAVQPKPNVHAPTTPSKEKKPTNPDQQVEGTGNENTQKVEQSKKESKGIAWETVEADKSLSTEALPGVTDEESESPSTEGEVSKDESEETISSGIKTTFDSEPHISTEPLRKSSSPLMAPKKKPESAVEPDTQHIETCSPISQPSEEPDSTASDTSASSLQTEEALPKIEVCSLNEPLTDSPSSSPLLCHLSGEKKKKAEEKSVDSGQHSDDESEGSGSEDTLAMSTAALRGSHPGLDVLDTSEDIQTSVETQVPQAATHLSPKIFPCRRSAPIVPLKPSAKARSASIGDLLAEPAVRPPDKPRPASARPPSDVTSKLETELALEIEKTSELQSRVSQARGQDEGDAMTEDLLAKAMEKLKKADHVLREVKKLKLASNSNKRKSW